MSWDMDCCGSPFAIGSEVEWELSPIGEADREFHRHAFGDELVESITDIHDTHGVVSDTPATVRGVVRSIARVHNAAISPVHIEPATNAGQWEQVSGWIVDIDESN